MKNINHIKVIYFCSSLCLYSVFFTNVQAQDKKQPPPPPGQAQEEATQRSVLSRPVPLTIISKRTSISHNNSVLKLKQKIDQLTKQRNSTQKAAKSLYQSIQQKRKDGISTEAEFSQYQQLQSALETIDQQLIATTQGLDSKSPDNSRHGPPPEPLDDHLDDEKYRLLQAELLQVYKLELIEVSKRSIDEKKLKIIRLRIEKLENLLARLRQI